MGRVDRIEFFVLGRPVPERRQLVLVKTPEGMKKRMLRTKKAEEWKKKVAAYALAAVMNAGGRKPLWERGPVALKLQFYFKPTRRMKHWPVPHTKRPDSTNLVKLCEDALTGIVWADDNQIVHTDCEKWYGLPEGVRITVKFLGGEGE